jgi:hypothetical protein
MPAPQGAGDELIESIISLIIAQPRLKATTEAAALVHVDPDGHPRSPPALTPELVPESQGDGESSYVQPGWRRRRWLHDDEREDASGAPDSLCPSYVEGITAPRTLSSVLANSTTHRSTHAHF